MMLESIKNAVPKGYFTIKFMYASFCLSIGFRQSICYSLKSFKRGNLYSVHFFFSNPHTLAKAFVGL